VPPSSGDTDAEGAVQLDLLLATEGSPEYPSVAAQLKLTAQLGGLRVHLAADSLSAVGELIVRCRGLIDRAAAAVARSAESPRTPKPAPSVAAALGAASGASTEPRASAPAVASGLLDEKPLRSRDNARDDATLAAPAAADARDDASAAAHAASAVASAKPVLAIEAYVGYLYVVLHEEPPAHIAGLGPMGAALGAAVAGLADLKLERLEATLLLDLDTMQIDAHVHGLGLTVRDGLGKAPLVVISTLHKGVRAAGEAANPSPPPREVSLTLASLADLSATAEHRDGRCAEHRLDRMASAVSSASSRQGSELAARSTRSLQRQESIASVQSEVGADVPTVTFSLAGVAPGDEPVDDAYGYEDGGAEDVEELSLLENVGEASELRGDASELRGDASKHKLLTFAMSLWDEKSERHPGYDSEISLELAPDCLPHCMLIASLIRYDSEISLELAPTRIFGPLPVVRRLQLCFMKVLDALTKGLLDRLGEQAAVAASALAAEGLRQVAAEQKGSGAKLRIMAHGPLIILPSATVPGTALVVRMADILFTNASDGAVHLERARAASASGLGPRASGRPAAAFERLRVSLEKTSIFVASSLSDLERHLDEEIALEASGPQPHWLVHDLKVTLLLEKQMIGGGGDDGAASGAAQGAEPSVELTLGLELSEIQISIATSECAFASLLAQEAMAVFVDAEPQTDETDRADQLERASTHIRNDPLGTAPTSEAAGGGGARDGATEAEQLEDDDDDDAEAGSAAVGGKPSGRYVGSRSGPRAPTTAPPSTDPSLGVTKMVFNGKIECAGGVQLELIDDSQGSLMPILELGVDEVAGSWTLVNDMVNGEVVALKDAIVQLTFGAHASLLNTSHGEWEPLMASDCLPHCMQVSLLNTSHGEWESVLEPRHIG